MDSELIKEIKKYLAETPLETLKENWTKLESLNLRGPNAYEYLDFLSESYYYYVDTIEKETTEITEKKTPKYSESFFFVNLCHE